MAALRLSEADVTARARRELKIVVYGRPAPQGSKRFIGVKGGHGLMIESSKNVKPWRQAVCSAAVEAMQGKPGQGFSGPVEMDIVFTIPKPKSAPKTRRTWPDRKPDLSKLVRSTEDALTDAGVWEDDARVVRCVAVKTFPGEGPQALPVPGAVISVRAVLI